MSRVSSASFPSLDGFWETIEVRDPLPSVPAEFGKPTHDLTWRNLAILNTRRKPYAYKFPWASWLSLFPAENPPVEAVPDDLSTADENQHVALDEEGERSPSAKLYSESWLVDGPFESLTELIVAEKSIAIIGVTRTESDRSHTSYMYGLISEGGEEQDESGPNAGIPPAFMAESDSSRRTCHSCILPKTRLRKSWGKICRGCDGGR
jgi:hypothetical protein